MAAFTARTVETTVASPESSASRMMTDFAAPRFARVRSLGFVGSPFRVTILSFPRSPARERISSSMAIRSTFAKMTTDARRMLVFATASSLRIGKMRFDQPRMSVWFVLMTALLPAFRFSTTPRMAVAAKPMMIASTAVLATQPSRLDSRSAQVSVGTSPRIPNMRAKTLFVKSVGSEGLLSGVP